MAKTVRSDFHAENLPPPEKNTRESGYGKLVFTSAGPSAAAVSLPVTVQGTVVTPACTDKDGDGYCNWGIGPKPTSCPATCKAEEDCDDSNAAIGACTFTQTTQAFVHVCREYLSSATYCPSSGQSCPAGYRAIASTTGCASTGKGKSKTIYWNYCARDFNSCGACPAGSVLAGNVTCGVGQVCSATTNQCG